MLSQLPAGIESPIFEPSSTAKPFVPATSACAVSPAWPKSFPPSSRSPFGFVKLFTNELAGPNAPLMNSASAKSCVGRENSMIALRAPLTPRTS